MKVALIRGPLVAPRESYNNEPTPPLGLAYLAGALKQAGFDVQGIDAPGEALERWVPIPNSKLEYKGIGIDETLERLDPAVRVIGVTSMFSHGWTFFRSLISSIKKRFPEKIIIAGGEHCTALPEYVLRDCPELDFVGLGEGEETMTEFCRRVADSADVNDVDGIAFLEDGNFVMTKPRQRIRKLDEIPWPDWETFPIGPYLSANISFGPSFGRNMPILATRGCPYQCTFCSNPTMWTTRYYMRSVEDVIAEIAYYRGKYDITGVQFYDLTAIIRKEWIVQFCQLLIERDWNLTWSLPSGTRSEALDDETLKWVARANCRYLVYAPESGSEATLKRTKKKISLVRMENSIQSAIENEITVRTNLIIGLPHETRRQLLETLRQQLKFAWMGVDEAPLYLFQPYPGSELFRGLVARGEIALNDSYFDSLAGFSTGLLRPPPRTFCQSVGRLELFTYRVLGMSIAYLLSYVLRPKRILRTIRNVLFSNRSSTVLEQRVKDRLRRLKGAGSRLRK